ncbi:uncharacterized protein G2W53_021189 [Senna tora]|uniref:Uncharacterized protein n=1 Tax=Senna tora TaxID=362788 RepID=A0A834TLG1_9FABA|nr:uncharacterized protein G2W53_021189 [Senna tora]
MAMGMWYEISREGDRLNCNTNGGDLAHVLGLSRHRSLREARETSCGKLRLHLKKILI